MYQSIAVQILLLIFSSCTQSQSEENLSESDADEEPKTTGTLEVSAVPLSTIVQEASLTLDENSSELDIPTRALQILLGNEATDEDDEETELYLDIDPGYLTSYKFLFTKIELSQDGMNWVTVIDNSNGIELDLVNGSDAIGATVQTGTYPFAFVEIASFKFTRTHCDEVSTEDEDVGAVLTTEERARQFGQRTDQLFEEFVGHDYFDLLQELFYYARSRPVDLIDHPTTILELSELESQKAENAYTETQSVLDWAKNLTTQTETYSGPETIDNTRPQCTGERIAEDLCNDFLATNTHESADGRKIDSYYWLLAEPLTIQENGVSSFVVTIDPTGSALTNEPCGVAPRDPIFIFGNQSSIVSTLARLGGKAE